MAEERKTDEALEKAVPRAYSTGHGFFDPVTADARRSAGRSASHFEADY